MIKVKNLCKSFNDKKVLKYINFSLPSKGMIFFLGDSGCGKTTLLNCIAGLQDFEGEIYIDHKNLNLLREKDKDYLRLLKIGFVFQDFRLFDSDSVFENIGLPLECITSSDRVHVHRKIKDLIELVGLKDKIDTDVSTLSGGEKQRVAIARSLVNDPVVLLCDEPTGALDSTNSKSVMDILKRVSTNHLVVVVSHDEELAKEYANEIYRFKDGRIIDYTKFEKKHISKYLAVFRNEFSLKKPFLPLGFSIRHSINALRKKKIRTMLTNFVASLGLLGIGLSFVLSDLIKDNIMKVYSSVIEDNQIVVSSNYNKQGQTDIVGAAMEDVFSLSVSYPTLIEGMGICYYAPFEDYFPTLNEICLANSSTRLSLSSYSIRNINEYVWLEDLNETVYPFKPDFLEDDQVVMSFTIFEIQQICYALRIERTVEALSYYIDNHPLYLCIDLANIDWQYEDQQIIELKGFTISNTPTIYHSNAFWNEYMFEERMRFPTNDNFTEQDYYPWVMKKIPYLKTMNDTSDFLEKCYKETNLAKYIFDVASSQFYPWLFNDVSSRFIDRILVFDNNVYAIDASDWNFFNKIEPRIFNPIFSTYGGYSIYGSSMLVGFSKPIFFSSSLDDLEHACYIYDQMNMEENDTLVLPQNVLQGHYSQSVFDGVTIKGLENKKIIGNYPSSVDEIVISSSMAKKLFGNGKIIGQEIYLSSLSKTYVDATNNVLSEFCNETLKVVGYINDDKNIIYQNEYWSLVYFPSRLNVSGFEMFVNCLTFEIEDRGIQNEVISKLSKEFPQYNFTNPLSDISKGIDDLCFYLEIILSILSLVAIIISIFLISINDYLHILERKRDIGLLRCIGLSKGAASSYVYVHSLVIALFAFFSSCFQLLIVSIVGGFALSKMMSVPFTFSFSIIPYAFMLLIAILCALLPAFLISFKVNKYDPLVAMKR